MTYIAQLREIRWWLLSRAQRRILQLAQRSGLFRSRPFQLFFPNVRLHHLGVLPSWVYKDIFVDHCYKWWHSSPLREIVDLGANVGLCSLYFAERYPAARVTAVEANPRAVEKLRRTLAGGRRANIKIIPVAVAATAKRLSMWIDHSSASYLNASITGRDIEGKRDVELIEVDGVVIDDLLPHHVDLLKVDVEGTEYEVLTSSCVEPARVKAIVLEAHDLHLDRSRSDFEALRRTLISRGYRYLDAEADRIRTVAIEQNCAFRIPWARCISPAARIVGRLMQQRRPKGLCAARNVRRRWPTIKSPFVSRTVHGTCEDGKRQIHRFLRSNSYVQPRRHLLAACRSSLD